MMGQSRQAQSVAIPKRWPLVQSLYTRDPNVPITQDSRLVNAYAELDPQDNEYWVYKRFGINPTPLIAYGGSLNAGAACGTYYFDDSGQDPSATSILFMVIAGTLYRYFPSTLLVSSAGAMSAGATAQFQFETVNSSPQTIVIKFTGGGYYYTPDTGVLTQITDVN